MAYAGGAPAIAKRQQPVAGVLLETAHQDVRVVAFVMELTGVEDHRAVLRDGQVPFRNNLPPRTPYARRKQRAI